MLCGLGKGPERPGETTPLGVAAGDRIGFGRWSGTEVKDDGEELLIMKQVTSWRSSRWLS